MKKILLTIILFFCFLSNCFCYTKSVVDITTMDVYEIQDAVDKGYLTYELLTRMYLERIEKYDSNFNTIITINSKAIEQAKEKDEEYKKYGRTSLIFGIPILVKDNIDVYGMPTTNGTKSLEDSYPNTSSSVIKLLEEKGAIILGKTNMSEFAFMASSSTSSYGTVKNAYDTSYSSYGSSGGTAVAISLSFASLGLGTDTNASIRVPASCNNVIGFRPTIDTITRDGIITYDVTRDTVGSITKFAYDNAILTAIMQEKNEEYYLKESNNKFKIGVINDFYIGNESGLYGTSKTNEEIVLLMGKILEKLENNNIEIIYIDNFYESKYSKIANSTTAGWTMCNSFNNYIKNTSSSLSNFYDLAYSKGHIYSLWDYVVDCGRDINDINTYDDKKKDYLEYVESIYEQYDIDFLVYPTTKNKLIKVGESTDSFSSPSALISSVLGLPSANVSLGSINNLYYGMEIMGLKNDELKMFQFINKYESINNTYKLSDLAKPLYVVPSSVNDLRKLYESTLNINIIKLGNYQEERDKVKDFLTNYNNYNDEEVEQISNNLYDSYSNSVNKVTSYLLIIIIGVLIVIFIFKKIVFKNKKHKKTNK